MKIMEIPSIVSMVIVEEMKKRLEARSNSRRVGDYRLSRAHERDRYTDSRSQGNRFRWRRRVWRRSEHRLVRKYQVRRWINWVDPATGLASCRFRFRFRFRSKTLEELQRDWGIDFESERERSCFDKIAEERVFTQQNLAKQSDKSNS